MFFEYCFFNLNLANHYNIQGEYYSLYKNNNKYFKYTTKIIKTIINYERNLNFFIYQNNG